MSDVRVPLAEERSSLKEALSNGRPLYILPRDDVSNLIISPAMSSSHELDIMMGFFSSQSFAEIAPGLAAFLSHSDQSLRLIVSPFISTVDQEAISQGLQDYGKVANEAIEASFSSEDALAHHTLRCLAWLISSGRLSMKVAIMKDGLFHPKVWIFKDSTGQAALHGSANMTSKGLKGNREQLSLSRSWLSDEAHETCRTLEDEFNLLWSDGDLDCRVFPLADALSKRLVQEFKGDTQPTEQDFQRLWRRAHQLSEDPADAGSLLKQELERRFSIPKWLNYRDGEYAHQGKAIDAWLSSGKRGILEMCTGSGKTLTALAAAQLLHSDTGQLLIVVAAPYNVLLSQWCREIELFGLRPINMAEAAGPSGRSRLIKEAKRRLRMNDLGCEILVVSNDTLCTPSFQEQLQTFPGSKLLIADECHNLGTAQFTLNPPDFFDYRMGLSATPIRQYDEEGTSKLFQFFGPPCFSFTLEDAIGKCLTPYEYHVTFVELNSGEMAEWRELSEKISKLAWKIDAGQKDSNLDYLLLQRRKILETAHSKLDALAELIDAFGPTALKYTLIYATDKDPEQLSAVNSLLHSRGVFFHQLTAEETSSSVQSQAIIERFRQGDFQVLTAKRVLDEGVNIPEILRAYVLASTTVRRQWVQRRGRLLRTCRSIGKEAAVIHDLVALPPSEVLNSNMDVDAKKIIKAELDRVWEFARLSRNAAATGGPFSAVERMRELIGG